MSNGKLGLAPCGHNGEHVIGNYVACKICDYEPDWNDITLEIPRCSCGSYDVDEDFQLDSMYYLFNPGAPILDTRCNTCGKCWTRS